MRAEPAPKSWIVEAVRESETGGSEWTEKTASYPLEFERLKDLFKTMGKEEREQFLVRLRIAQKALFPRLGTLLNESDTLRDNLNTIEEIQKYARSIYLAGVEQE